MTEPWPTLTETEAFGPLRAEGEPWLPAVYVAPGNLSGLVAPRSFVVVGERGSGKSALLAWLSTETAMHQLLPVSWQWDPLAWPGATISQAQIKLLSGLLFQITRTLFLAIGCDNDRWQTLLPTARRWLGRLFVRYLLPDDSWLITIPPALQAIAQARLAESQTNPSPGVPETLSPIAELGYLIPLLEQVGYHGLVVLLEDIGPWVQLDQSLEELFRDFLSMLALFDVRGLCFKIVADTALLDLVRTSPVIARRRAELVRLQWPSQALETIAIRRLQSVFGPAATLDTVYSKPALIGWLTAVGGPTPRGWLEALAPLVGQVCQIRAQEGALRALKPQEWHDIRRQNLPALTYDETTGTVTIGWRQVTLSAGEEALFRYLFERRGQVCPRRELYRAYMQKIYGPEAPMEEHPGEYRGMLDTALYRLREAIEPDPKDPLLLVTVRDRGLSLL